MQLIARKVDVAGRDERNRALGRAGEERALQHERAVLIQHNRDDLARRVRWVAEEDGDGAGYDIASFEPDGRARLVEVKTTNGWERTPFFISRNELDVANERRAEWRLLRLWDFSREPKAFEVHPPLDADVSLTAAASEAAMEPPNSACGNRASASLNLTNGSSPLASSATDCLVSGPIGLRVSQNRDCWPSVALAAFLALRGRGDDLAETRDEAASAGDCGSCRATSVLDARRVSRNAMRSPYR
jgi:hypothetical protein